MDKSELKQPIASSHQGSLIELIQQFLACSRHLQRVLSVLAEKHSITDSQFLILSTCCDSSQQGISQMQISNLLAISPGQVSNLVEQLRVRGLLEGVRCEHDRRKQLWKTTTEGKRLFQHAFHDVQKWSEEKNLVNQAGIAQYFTTLLEEFRDQVTPSTSRLRIHCSTESTSS